MNLNLAELATHAHEQEVRLRAFGEVAEAQQWEAIGWAARVLIGFELRRAARRAAEEAS